MLSEILVNVLIVLAVTSLLGYFASAARRSTPKLDKVAGTRTFGYVIPYKVLAVGSIAIPIFLGILAVVTSVGKTGWVLALIFGSISGYLLLECFGSRIIIYLDAITSISPWTGRRTFRWEEILSVTYSQASMWHIIRGPAGKKIYASAYLAGAGELVAELHKTIPPEKWKR